MKVFSLSSKFYILFCLILSVPAYWAASVLKVFVDNLSANNFFHYLSSVGIFEAPTTLVILLGLFWLFNNIIWKFYPIRKLLGIPNINGRYEGELTSTHTENNEQNGTYKICLEIKQSLTSISVFLYTERSCSYSLIASIGLNGNHNHELMYVYQNKTSAMNNDSDMRDHKGSAFLEIFEDGKNLIGNYFNNPRERGRYGVIKVEKVKSSIQGKF
jgi:hypothetical protein